jgi:UDP-GlcNAc:undecaprenyl-phosphate/decaprenyl-phosphate GlcNAc-1-phosphate transferase
MNDFKYLLIPGLSFLFTYCFIVIILKTNIPKYFIDIPNARSLHNKGIPRLGGIPVILSIILSLLLLPNSLILDLIGPLILVTLVSISDDLFKISRLVRISAHLAASILFIYSLSMGYSLFLYLIITGIFVWVINLYNFMDGSDGLAGGMAVIGFGSYSIASLINGDLTFFVINNIISFSALAFLLFNFSPAKIFLGDAGSISIGFLAASIGLVGINEHIWPIWFPLFIFSPFIVDSTHVLFRRAVSKEKIFDAHNTHSYQRLVQITNHKITASYAYILMIFISAVSIYSINSKINVVLLLSAALIFIYSFILVYISRRWKNNHLKIIK